MKKIFIDPEKSFFKANLHCHSTNSDGNMTVEEIKEHYKANGYSIIAFTDHEHLIDNSHLNDGDFLAITACEVAIKEFDKLSTLKKMDMKVCHLNFYSQNPSNIDTPCYNSVYDHFVNDKIKDKICHTCGEYKREYSSAGISKMIEDANKNGFLVSYNHPRWSLENATDYLGYKNLWAVEIYNHSCWQEGICEYDINVYDDFLRRDEKLACIAGDDNHTIDNTCGGYTVINAEKLDYDTVFDALREHNIYTSTGPIIRGLYIENNVAHLTFEKGEYAIMSTKGRRTVKKLAENSNGENMVEFRILPDEDGYVRFDVVDKSGKRANTCAYFLEDM